MRARAASAATAAAAIAGSGCGGKAPHPFPPDVKQVEGGDEGVNPHVLHRLMAFATDQGVWDMHLW